MFDACCFDLQLLMTTANLHAFGKSEMDEVLALEWILEILCTDIAFEVHKDAKTGVLMREDELSPITPPSVLATWGTLGRPPPRVAPFQNRSPEVIYCTH